MAIKTFTTGDILTASDTNTYLANAGLQVITPSSVTNGTLSGAKVTVGTTVSSVTVNGVFSATYDAYRIVLQGGSGSATNTCRLTLGATATGYYYAGKGRTYAGVDVNIDNNNVNGFWYGAESAANGMTGIIDIVNPFLSEETYYSTSIAAPRTDGYLLQVAGFLNNTTSYTAFTITFGTGTQTGGTITCYGYRVG